MEGTNALDVERSSLLEEGLNLHAVFAADVEIVAAGFAGPVVIVRHPEGDLLHCAEAAERIGREEQFLGGFVGNHHLRPVHHRSHREAQGVAAERERVALFDGQRATFQGDALEELGQHLQRGSRRHERQRRIFLQHLGDERGVVGLHMVDYQVIGGAAFQRFGQVGFPGFALAAVGRVQDGHFVVEDQIGIIGHPFRDDILALK